MSPKASNGNSGRKNRSLPKYRERGRSKKPEKNKCSTNIPLPVNMMSSQSLLKRGKRKFTTKKTNKTDGKILTGSHSSSLKRKETGILVLEKLGKISEKYLSNPANSSNEAKIPGNKTTEGAKLKEFNEILPLCEKELRKIEDAWLSAAYCSLSLRANLFKFLSQSFPNIEKGQFYTEDKELIKYLEKMKSSNKAETKNLLNIIKSVLANREKTKDEYSNMYKNEKYLRKKISRTKEESKHLKTVSCIGSPTKNDNAELIDSEKPQVIDYSNKNRGTPVMSLFTIKNQQNPHKANVHFGKQNEKILNDHNTSNSHTKQNEKNSKAVTYNTLAKQSENSSKSNPVPNAEGQKLKNIKPLSIKKDFKNLKTDFVTENEVLEKKVKELENVLEEKIKKLKCEKGIKDRLNSSLTQFQTQKRTISMSHGFEQLEYILGLPSESGEKWRRELWLTAIRLILSGFFVQLKNLETERNKMLYHLQSNDIDNLNSLVVTINRKENFIKNQIKSLNDSYHGKKEKKCEAQEKN